MQTNEQFQTKTDLSLLLIGPPFSGKTNVAMKFPAPWFASTDRKLTNAVQNNPGKVFFYDYYNDVGLGERWGRLMNDTKQAFQDPRVQTVIWDNLTDIQEFLVAHLLNVGGAKLTVAGIPVMDRSYWQPFKILLARAINTFKACGKPFIVICHETSEKDELSGMVLAKPLLSGQLQDSLPSLFSNVWRTEVETSPNGDLYKVRASQTARFNFLGNCFRLPPAFVFTWDEFEKHLQKHGFKI